MLIVLTAVLFVVVGHWYFRRLRHPLPPGPTGYPLIGNIFDLPKGLPCLDYSRMGKVYSSDIISLNLLGTPLIGLNSAKAINDLLEKRSSIYSDRPRSVMLHELTGWERAFGFLNYGPWWRAHRRVFHQHFNDYAIKSYEAKSSLYAKRLLRRLLGSPEHYSRHILRMLGALMINISYGFDVKEDGDGWLVAAETAMQGLDEMGRPGNFYVDVFPILRYLPSWLPGIHFRKRAEVYKGHTEAMFEYPYQAVRDHLHSGTAKTSIATALLSQMESEPDQEQFKKLSVSILGSAFAGGQDTTATVIMWFVQAMLLHPKIQDAAQTEIDRVVGADRLPEHIDRDTLPLITAVMYEVLRWRPMTPLGMPRLLREDDEYKGYHMPAGSIVFANIWAILHDEDIYADPDTFNPYRFLTAEGKISEDVPKPEAAFGFGRRVCPAAFRIEKPLDRNGRPIEPVLGYTNDTICHPTPFEVAFKPRSAAAVDLIHSFALSDVD